jgi:hypothetical protein
MKFDIRTLHGQLNKHGLQGIVLSYPHTPKLLPLSQSRIRCQLKEMQELERIPKIINVSIMAK